MTELTEPTERLDLLPTLRKGRIWNSDGSQGPITGAPSNCFGYRCHSEQIEAEGGYANWAEHKHIKVVWRDTSGSPLQTYHEFMGPDDAYLRANVDRFRVENYWRWDNPTVPIPAMRLVNGLEGRPGGVEVGEHFSEAVGWQRGRVLKYIVEFQYANEREERAEINTARVRANKEPYPTDAILTLTKRFLNIEMRGLLHVKPKDNPPEVLSFNYQDQAAADSGQLYIKWWKQVVKDAPVHDRAKVKFDYTLKRGHWYRYAAILTGLESQFSWDFETRFSVWGLGKWDEVWKYHDAEYPLVQIENVGWCHLGDEHNLERDQSGGVIRFTQPRAQTWIEGGANVDAQRSAIGDSKPPDAETGQ